MSRDDGAELSFDPRTWLPDDAGREARPPQAPRKSAKHHAAQPLLAGLAAAGILVAGATAAYATREPAQPASNEDLKQR